MRDWQRLYHFIVVLPVADEEEAEAMRRVHRLPAEGQLRRLRALPQRQVPPDLQTAALREAHREKGRLMCSFSLFFIIHQSLHCIFYLHHVFFFFINSYHISLKTFGSTDINAQAHIWMQNDCLRRII